MKLFQFQRIGDGVAEISRFLAAQGWDLTFLSFLAVVMATIGVLVGLAIFVRAGRAARLGSQLQTLSEAVARQDLVLRDELKTARGEAAENGRHLREEIFGTITRLSEAVGQEMRALIALEREQLATFSSRLAEMSALQERRMAEQHEAQLSALREIRDQVSREITLWKADSSEKSLVLAETVTRALKLFSTSMGEGTAQLLQQQKAQMEGFEKRLNDLSEANQQRGEGLRATVEAQLNQLRVDNSAKLDLMRQTVDEKLQGTLEQRLGDSFRLVSERLEAVHKGLGEVQVLATGVGDLKRVMTNVKVRGGWGEVQLGALLEQMMAPGQYVANAQTSEHGAERVEFAIRMPGSEEGQHILLPIDSKFPIEDYERLQFAAEAGDALAVEAASKALEKRIRLSADEISRKYINPPRTTDFAILFLPTEGLFAEVIRRASLVDDLQRNYRIVIAGPTTLSAMLSSLQMGFRTLTIQQRSSEVWQVLGSVKAEFGLFGDVLKNVRKKLTEAGNHIDKAETRSRAIHRKLRDVETAPGMETAGFLGLFDESTPVENDRDGDDDSAAA